MYDKLYSNQEEWGETNNANDFFIKYAQELKLNLDKFKSDINSKKYEKKVQKDIDDGYAVSVDSTPTFFINGVKQEAGIQYNDFKTQIDAALSAK
jgi:protein-disulfide isomerase